MKNEYLHVAAVAQWLGVTRKRVYAMIQEGKIKAIRLGPRQTRIARASVEAFIERLERLHEDTLGLGAEERNEIEQEVFQEWAAR